MEYKEGLSVPFESMAKILLVDDDLSLADDVKVWLEQAENHVLEVVHDGESAKFRLSTFHYDVIILDLWLPDIDGLDVLRDYRKTGGTAPVLLLTGRTDIDDRSKGLDAGADDYLCKPFHAKELSARVRALLRRPRELTDNVLKCGELELDRATMRFSRAGEEIALLPKELALLELFMRSPDHIFTADEIIEKVWSSESESSAETVRVHIARLRKKIDRDGKPSLISTIRGLGYSLKANGAGNDE